MRLGLFITLFFIQTLSIVKCTPITSFENLITNTDSCTITFKVSNPYNCNKMTPGVIIKMEKDTWNDFNKIVVTDLNGIAKIKISKKRIDERILVYYSKRFYTYLNLSTGDTFNDIIINIKLNYSTIQDEVTVLNGPVPNSRFFVETLIH